jgi:hypothetical protein
VPYPSRCRGGGANDSPLYGDPEGYRSFRDDDSDPDVPNVPNPTS